MLLWSVKGRKVKGTMYGCSTSTLQLLPSEEGSTCPIRTTPVPPDSDDSAGASGGRTPASQAAEQGHGYTYCFVNAHQEIKVTPEREEGPRLGFSGLAPNSEADSQVSDSQHQLIFGW